ncbi:MAG: T9SS type A sorting domain-containing protein [Bacteroidales bacterium]|nr:T9SS type A sorting domain-containing protein [Bacteroidales bacterium]
MFSVNPVQKKIFQHGICLLNLLFFSLTAGHNLHAQDSPQAFRLNQNNIKKIAVQKQISQGITLYPFTVREAVSGLAIDAEISLNSDTSLVRIILIDEKFSEYLVYETYPLLNNKQHFSITRFADETVDLNHVVPVSLKIEIIDASLLLKEIIVGQDLQTARKRTLLQQQEQQAEKIKSINTSLQRTGQKWIAGKTSLSEMSYAEKKLFFGGRIPNLQGFEYYTGGIYLMPGTFNASRRSKMSLPPPAKIELPYVKEFNWRHRHGQDWMTPVKNQQGCGSCWAFGAVAATELLANIYFNRHLDLDLSEQELVSCSEAGDCSGGNLTLALNHIQNKGIRDEACFPYIADNAPCNLCSYYDNRIILGTIYYWTQTFDCVKTMIITGPVTMEVLPWSHVVALAGYKTIEPGDSIYTNSSEIPWIKIAEGDPLVGQTAWQIKNSYGTNFGEQGYAWIVCDVSDLGWVYRLSLHSSYGHSKLDIACVDNDGDGYYSWGTGPKPDHCPPCPDLRDGDDSDPCLGPIDSYGRYTLLPLPPLVRDTIINEGEPIPDLVATGTGVKWYADADLTQLIHEGTTYSPGISSPGIHQFYVTQTLGSCEGGDDKVTLTIFTEVNPPLVSDAIGCTGCPLEVTAEGENLNWYLAPGNTDPRDGQTYKSVQIGEQIWMAENLNFFTPEGSAYIEHDSLNNAEVYGRLYTWETARKVCPSGWKLPSDEEWKILERTIGMSVSASNMGGWRGTTEGNKLKEPGEEHWLPENFGTDDYGFTVLPAGFYSGSDFVFQGEKAYFWTRSYTTLTNLGVARSFSNNESKINRDFYCMSQYHSVRCIQANPSLLASGDTLRNAFMAPGVYTLYATQTKAGFESEPAGLTLTIYPVPSPPVVQDVEVIYGDVIPPLIAEGEDICWYADETLTQCVFEGDTFQTGMDQPGMYTYYVTQTEDCSSQAIKISLTITPLPPDSEDQFACFGETIPNMTASGQNIKWYIDPELSQLLYSGSPYSTGINAPGTYPFYVTQTIQDIESDAWQVNLTIGEYPELFAFSDTTIFLDEYTLLASSDNFDAYVWFDGSTSSSLKLEGEQLGVGEFSVWLRVTDSLGCIVSDTVKLKITDVIALQTLPHSEVLRIHPNPTSGTLNFQFTDRNREQVEIHILSESGNILMKNTIGELQRNETVTLDLFSLPTGIYILQIIEMHHSEHALILISRD